MSAAAQNFELFELFCAQADGTISAEQHQVLDARLVEDEQARRAYLEFMNVEASLAMHFGAMPGDVDLGAISGDVDRLAAPRSIKTSGLDCADPDPLIDTYEEAETLWFDPTDRRAQAAGRNPVLSSPLHYGERSRLHPGESVKQDARQRKS